MPVRIETGTGEECSERRATAHSTDKNGRRSIILGKSSLKGLESFEHYET